MRKDPGNKLGICSEKEKTVLFFCFHTSFNNSSVWLVKTASADFFRCTLAVYLTSAALFVYVFTVQGCVGSAAAASLQASTIPLSPLAAYPCFLALFFPPVMDVTDIITGKMDDEDKQHFIPFQP